MKEYIDGNRIFCIPNHNMKKLQEMLGTSCYNYIQTQYSLMIYGDNGKPGIYEKVLQRIAIDTLGKVKENIHIIMILDDDGLNYETLNNTISNKLEFISKDRSKFNPLPCLNDPYVSFLVIIGQPTHKPLSTT